MTTVVQLIEAGADRWDDPQVGGVTARQALAAWAQDPSDTRGQRLEARLHQLELERSTAATPRAPRPGRL